MKQAFSIIGIIVGAILIIMSLTVEVPSKKIDTGFLGYGGDYTEYVGGDAYNFQIEASLRGGQIAGARAEKAIYLTGGLMVLVGSLIALGFAAQNDTKQRQKKASGSANTHSSGKPSFQNNETATEIDDETKITIEIIDEALSK